MTSPGIPAGRRTGKAFLMNLINRMVFCLRDKGFRDLPEDERAGKIDEGALAILRKLNEEGKEAYVVGGSVRDLLMGLVPHDWDITTSATPEQVKADSERDNWMIAEEAKEYGLVDKVIYKR